ncbi:MAG: periplasmic heavy metal sensor [Parvibaculum sp.]
MSGKDEIQTSPDGAVSAPRRKWIGPVLLVSLVLNLFFGALLATGSFHRFYHQEGRGGSMAMPMPMHHRLITQSLSKEERRAFREMMRERFDTLRIDFGDVRKARMGLSRAIGAEPYDPVATKAAFDTMRLAMDTIADKAQSAMVESFASLPRETRARIAENMAKGREGMRRDGMRDGPMRDGPRSEGWGGRGDALPPVVDTQKDDIQ